MPLSFFPGSLGTIVGALPFASVYWTPLRIYIGQVAPAEIPGLLAVQMGWLVLFAGVSAVVWRLAERRVVVQGG